MTIATYQYRHRHSVMHGSRSLSPPTWTCRLFTTVLNSTPKVVVGTDCSSSYTIIAMCCVRMRGIQLMIRGGKVWEWYGWRRRRGEWWQYGTRNDKFLLSPIIAICIHEHRSHDHTDAGAPGALQSGQAATGIFLKQRCLKSKRL